MKELIRRRYDNWVFGLLLFFLLVCHIRLMLNSGFIFDDWGSILTASSGYLQSIQNWTPIWLIRPLSLIILPAIISFFGSLASAYFLLNFLLIYFSLYMLVLSLKDYMSAKSKQIFILLALAPTVASTSLLSSVNQLEMSFSLLFMASYAWVCTMRYKSKLYFYIRSTLLVIVSMFFYEVTLPLVVVPMFLSWKKSREALLITVYSILSALSIVTLWQKILVPNFVPRDLSRISTLNLESGATYVYQIFVGIPLKLLTGVLYSNLTLIVFLISLTGILVIQLRKVAESASKSENEKIFVLNSFLGLGFFIALLLFLFSGLIADTSSYSNRLIFSTWLLLSLTIAINAPLWKSRLAIICTAIFMASNLANFSQTVNEAIAAKSERNQIVTSMNAFIKRQGISFEQTKSVFVDVPCLLTPSLSRTVVFCANWDLDSALRLEGYDGPPVYVASSSSLYDESNQTLTMGDSPIENAQTLLLVRSKSGFFQSFTFDDPVSMFDSNSTIFSRRNLREIEGSNMNCLNFLRDSKNWLNTELKQQKKNLTCLSDPFPLHV